MKPPFHATHLDLMQFLGTHEMHLSADIHDDCAYVWMLDLEGKRKKLSGVCDPAALRSWCAEIIERIDGTCSGVANALDGQMHEAFPVVGE